MCFAFYVPYISGLLSVSVMRPYLTACHLIGKARLCVGPVYYEYVTVLIESPMLSESRLATKLNLLGSTNLFTYTQLVNFLVMYDSHSHPR